MARSPYPASGPVCRPICEHQHGTNGGRMREIMCFFAHQGRFGVGSGCQARPRRAVAEMPQPWTGLRATQTKTLSREAALSRSCRKRAESVQKMCRIFWLRSLACRLMCGVLTALKMSSTTPGSPGKIPQARRRRARRRAPRKGQKPTQSIRTVGVPNSGKTCTYTHEEHKERELNMCS